MSKIYALFNPLSNNCSGKEEALKLKSFYPNDEVDFIDVTGIECIKTFFESVDAEDKIVVCGGDGTLNRFVNATYDLGLKNDIFYYATGSGNDFLRDLDKTVEDGPVQINEHICDLPIVTVNGKEWRFINGVGFGIDGYCCEVGDKMREDSVKKINYTAIAIKGLLFHYHPTNAVVTVDGKEYEFNKVWIAPTMVGRYYGGGINPAPAQRREDRRDHVSFSVLYNSGRVHTLMIFPTTFKGEHVKYTKNASVIEGKNIKVVFDRPTPLQIDGETILDVTEYQVRLAD